jgi:hypothetical protein
MYIYKAIAIWTRGFKQTSPIMNLSIIQIALREIIDLAYLSPFVCPQVALPRERHRRLSKHCFACLVWGTDPSLAPLKNLGNNVSGKEELHCGTL